MKTQIAKLFFAVVIAVTVSPTASAQSDTLTVRTDFHNLIYTNTPTLAPDTSLANAASVAFFSGNIGAATNELVGSTNIVRPNDGAVYLLTSAIGQPVGMFTVPFNLFVQGTGTNFTAPKPELWFQLYQAVSLQATPGRYYEFAGWSDGGLNNPRAVIAGVSNGFTATFTNTVPLFTTNIGGADYVTQLGKPLVFIDGQLHPHDVVVTTNGAQFSVTIVSTYPNGTNRYTLDGSDPIGGQVYSGAFNVTAPFRIRATGFTSANTTPREADTVVSLHKFTPGGGSAAAVPQTDFFNGSASAALTATPDAGWTFLNWSGDSTGTNPVITLTMDQPKAVSAIFGTTVSPTVNDVTRGYVTNLPTQSLYAYGSMLRLAAAPLTTNYFASWGGAQGVAFGGVNPAEFPVTNANPGIEANFANLSGGNQSLAVVTIGEGDVAKSPSANFYPNGVNVTLTATPRTNQSFVSWSGDTNGTMTFGTNLSVTMTNSKVIYATFAVTEPQFRFSQADYPVNQADGSVAVTIQNIGVLGTNVTVSTANLTAVGGNGNTGDYQVTTTNLTFAGGPGSQTIQIPIRNQFLIASSRNFRVSLSGAPLTSPSNTTVTISYTGLLTTNGSQLMQAYPGQLPQMNGALQVTMDPPESAGQWRFRWEDIWRNDGQIVTNLEGDLNYDVEFRDVAGFVPYPANLAFPVNNSGITPLPGQYYPTLAPAGLGSLQVDFVSPPVGARWRLLGESVWRNPGDTVTGLVPGTNNNVIQFATVSGRQAPPVQAVEIIASQLTHPTFNYLSASLPASAALPNPIVSFSLINVTPANTPRLPFVFNGQLKSPINGYGSGVAVCSNVVLTAAHVVFDYRTLSYAGPVYWFFQKHAGEFEPHPLTARGWNVLSGYADARTNDYTAGLSADQSSSQSRNYDVAALYFTEPAARGGFGGYLSSDLPVNEWLTGSYPKMLVGYPVDAAADGYTNVVAGKMHATPTNFAAISQSDVRVYGTPDFLNFGGNSGGPVYVLCTNNLYYPAAIYLGRLNNFSVMRAIDSNVVSLIVRSALLGDVGTNNTGGGVITLNAASVTAGNPAYVQVLLGPPAAVQAGAGWRLSGDSSYGNLPTYTRTVTNNGTTLQFKPIDGWNPPANQSVQIVAGVVNVISNRTYTVISPMLSFLPGVGIGIAGTTNTKYRIEYRTDLAAGPWLPFRTNTLAGGFNLVLPWPPTNNLPAAFYRAIWLP